LTGTGPSPRRTTIVDRAGCDLDPRDPADPQDALILRSFLPPEYDEDREELDDALRLAARSDVLVERDSATDWLRAVLAEPADSGVYTVVWHSLLWHYLDEVEQAEIESILTNRARSLPLARISYEPTHWASPPRLQITVYS
jgi:hypothetical protein